MNVLDEIDKFADEADKPVLRWLFDKYHTEAQWKFVAKCEHQRYGTQSYQTNRVWSPTEEGRALYAYKLENEMKPGTAQETTASAVYLFQSHEQIIAQALDIVSASMRKTGDLLTSPSLVRAYLRLRLAQEEREHFMAVFLDAQNCVIADEILFSGTLSQTSVYPREVVKRALALNAGGVILAHNHPSGLPEPSRADESITAVLKQALALVDVRLLDHFIVGGDAIISFAERGLI